MEMKTDKRLETPKKKLGQKLGIIHKIKDIMGIFGVIISTLAFVTTLYPQIVLGNDNLINKANAGHIESQMLLAEHYFEIGEYDDSIYWYKLASTKKGKYQAVACNNLAVIYANGFGLPDIENDGYYRYERAYQLFRTANDLGLSQGKENAINILRMNGVECFPNLNKNEINTFLKDNYYTIVESTLYKSFDKPMGKIYWDDNIKYTLSGTYTSTNENFAKTYWMYYGHKVDAEIVEYKEYKFVYLSELND